MKTLVEEHTATAKALVPPGIETLSQYQQLLWKETALRTAWFIAQETTERRHEMVNSEASQIIGDLNLEFEAAHELMEAYCGSSGARR